MPKRSLPLWTAAVLLLLPALGAAESSARLADRMFVALCGGDAAGVEQALAEGADPNEQMEGGVTALHVAAFQGRAQIVAALVRAGAELDAQDYTVGATPLIAAAAAGRAEVEKVLLQAGADPALCDRSGKTAKEYAPASPEAKSGRHGEALRTRYQGWIVAAEDAARKRLGVEPAGKAAAGSAYEQLKGRRGQVAEDRREGDRAKRNPSPVVPPPSKPAAQ